MKSGYFGSWNWSKDLCTTGKKYRAPLPEAEVSDLWKDKTFVEGNRIITEVKVHVDLISALQEKIIIGFSVPFEK